MRKIKGCFPALVTPMQSGNPLNYPINYETMSELIEHVVKNGVDGVVPSGCTGHAASLRIEEQIKLIKYVLDVVKDRVTVIAGDGSNCTREAIELAKALEDIGIKIHLQISPYQNKPTQPGIFEHYAKIAEAIEGEIIIYNVPGRTGKNIEAETTVKLAKEFSNIIGIKEASGDLEQIKRIINETKDMDFSVISGDDALTFDIIKAGGTGCISVAANVDPKRTSEYIHLALDGKFNEASEINDQLKELFRVLFVETNPCPAHYALRKMGIPVGIPRLPLVDVTEDSAGQIDKALKDLNLI